MDRGSVIERGGQPSDYAEYRQREAELRARNKVEGDGSETTEASAVEDKKQPETRVIRGVASPDVTAEVRGFMVFDPTRL
jgi:hypothetical protein